MSDRYQITYCSFMQKSKDGQEVVFKGLALPADAMSWLSYAFEEIQQFEEIRTQGKDDDSFGDEDYDCDDNISDCASVKSRYSASASNMLSGMGLTDPHLIEKYAHRLSLLRDKFLPRATHVRITDEPWPSRTKISSKRSSSIPENRHYTTSSIRSSEADDSSVSRSTIGEVMSRYSCVSGSSHPISGEDEEYLDGLFPNSSSTEDGECFDGDNSTAREQDSVAGSSFVGSRTMQWQSKFMYGKYVAPRIDVGMFPNLSVLVLDAVPPEWIVNMSSIRSSLRLLRVQGGAVYNLNSFLFNSGSDNKGELNGDEKKSCEKVIYPHLTHFRLTRCAVGELSGLCEKVKRKKKRENGDKYKVASSLVQLPKLTALNLSHNEIIHATTLFAGVRNLPLLTRIDLSYNRISSLKNMHFVLGNIRILVLSHNQISCLRGVERMYGLERLELDNNLLGNLADVASLANLPCLHSITLEGNPFVKKQPNYRMQILHLFQQARSSGEDVENMLLPILDGNKATKKELDELSKLFYSKGIKRDQSPVKYIPTRFSVSRGEKVLRVSTTRNVCIDQIAKLNTREKVVDDSFCTIDLEFPTHFSVCDIISSNNVKISSQLNSRANRMKRIRSLRTKKLSKGFRPLPGNSPVVSSSTYTYSSGVDSTSDEDHCTNADTSETNGSTSRSELPNAHSQMVSSAEISDSDGQVKESFSEHGDDEVATCIKNSRQLDNAITGNSVLPDNKNVPLFSDQNIGNLLHVKGFQEGRKIRNRNAKEVSLTAENEQSDNVLSILDKIDAAKHGRRSKSKNSRQSNLSMLLEKIDEATDGKDDKVSGDPTVKSKNNPSVEAPDGLLSQKTEHENKLRLRYISNVACPIHDGHNFYEDHEYDGPRQHSSLIVNLSIENLRLYYRSFVFGMPTKEGMEGQSWRPRILVFKSDKDVGMNIRQEKGMEGKLENFADIYDVQVIFCGREALIRQSPKVTISKDVGGNNDPARIGLISEARKTLICFSDEALYFIPNEFVDEMQRADVMNRKDRDRPFPSPMNSSLSFKDGSWPHAIARHPFDFLNTVSIGFQFQRLVLNFVVPASTHDDDSGGSFTYVILMSNKRQTLSLFRVLQTRARESVGVPMSYGSISDGFTIENDDQNFLEALAGAIEPLSLGALLHYQLLEQYWRKTSDAKAETIRRAFVVTDEFIFLLDEFYCADGSSIKDPGSSWNKKVDKDGSVQLQLIDSSSLKNVADVVASDADPRRIKIIVKSSSRMLASRRTWRLVCNDRDCAELLVENVRRAMHS